MEESKRKRLQNRGVSPAMRIWIYAWAQTIHMQAAEAIVPLANGYFQGMKTSQCQAKDSGQNFVRS